MKVRRDMNKINDIDKVNIKGIKLLNFNEYKGLIGKIPFTDSYWWLNTPNNKPYEVGYINTAGALEYQGVSNHFGVRPALICELAEGVKQGDKLQIAGHNWTVISDTLIHCDEVIGHTPFREDFFAEDANNYETSDIKQWVDNWYQQEITPLIEDKQLQSMMDEEIDDIVSNKSESNEIDTTELYDEPDEIAEEAGYDEELAPHNTDDGPFGDEL